MTTIKTIFLILLIVFMTSPLWAASKTFISGGTNNNWGTANNWSPVASVPAAGDDVFLDASSPNCVVNVTTNVLKSFDMNGYTNTLSGSSGIRVRAAASTTVNCRFAGTITWNGLLELRPNSTAGVINLTTNGKTIYQVMQKTNTGTVVLQDDLTSTFGYVLETGTLTVGANDISGSSALFQASAGTTVNMGSGTWTINNGFDEASGATVNCETSTLILSPSANLYGYTYYNIVIPANCAIYNNGVGYNVNTCHDLTINAGVTLTIYAGATLDANGTFNAVGTVGSPITIKTNTATSAAYLPVTTVGTVSYVTATDIDSSGGNEIYDENGTLTRTVNWTTTLATGYGQVI